MINLIDKNMTKSDLIREIHARSDNKFTLKDLDGLVETIFGVISERLGKGEEVQIANFGSFSLTRFAVKPAELHLKQRKIK